MIDRWFYFGLDENDKIVEASTSVELTLVDGGAKIVAFNMNVLDKKGILSAIDNYDLEPRLKEHMKSITNMFFPKPTNE